MLKKIHQSLLQKSCFADETKKISRANSDSYKSNFNAKTGVCCEASISEEEDVGMRKNRRKVILSIQTRNKMENEMKRRRLNYLSVVGKVTKKIK